MARVFISRKGEIFAMLKAGFHAVPPGMVAAVVTHLEMCHPQPMRPVPQVAGAALRRVEAPDIAWYRDIFKRVGGDDWLWFSRLALDDAALARVLSDPGSRISALSLDGRDEGFFELQFSEDGTCELAFLGVTRAALGIGAGRMMMAAALAEAWAGSITRLTVHTCTFDHPAALDFYRRCGFHVTAREVEVAPDPRLSGVLGPDAAPHIPILR